MKQDLTAMQLLPQGTPKYLYDTALTHRSCGKKAAFVQLAPCAVKVSSDWSSSCIIQFCSSYIQTKYSLFLWGQTFGIRIMNQCSNSTSTDRYLGQTRKEHLLQSWSRTVRTSKCIDTENWENTVMHISNCISEKEQDWSTHTQSSLLTPCCTI